MGIIVYVWKSTQLDYMLDYLRAAQMILIGGFFWWRIRTLEKGGALLIHAGLLRRIKFRVRRIVKYGTV